MDPEVRSGQAGVCPRCGMKLVLHVPEAVEHPLEISSSPDLLKPGDEVTLTFRVRDPEGRTVNRFEIVHEKLMHVFVVSENLEFFAHEHPQPEAGGAFRLRLRLPWGGMYRLLADYYPAGSVPQLAVKTLFVSGSSRVAKLQPALAPSTSENLTAALRTNPDAPLAGLESRLFFTLEPAAGLEPFLGAWGHLLAVSDDLVDFLHVHPFLADGGPLVQFNLVFPRPRLYRVWAQFQRLGVVNTAEFTIPVRDL